MICIPNLRTVHPLLCLPRLLFCAETQTSGSQLFVMSQRAQHLSRVRGIALACVVSDTAWLSSTPKHVEVSNKVFLA